MFWSLFISVGHSAWEPASFVYNDKQGDLLFVFYGLTQDTILAAHYHTWKSIKLWGKNASEWTGRVLMSKEGIPCSKVACMTICVLLQALMGRRLSSRSQQMGTLISASAVPNCGLHTEKCDSYYYLKTTTTTTKLYVFSANLLLTCDKMFVS